MATKLGCKRTESRKLLKRKPISWLTKKNQQPKSRGLTKISPKQAKRIRKLAKIKPPEDGKCEFCHQFPDFRGLAKHHKVFRSHNGSDDRNNLIWLCGKCHDKCHGIVDV